MPDTRNIQETQAQDVPDVQNTLGSRNLLPNPQAMPLSEQLISAIRSENDRDLQRQIAENAVASVGLKQVSLNQRKVHQAQSAMSIKLDDWKVTSQKRSGRCWLFAALNLLRSKTMVKLGVKDFEFSQAHACFWDKFERANYFLETMISLADQPLNSRLIQFLLKDVLSDGGQWDMLTSIFLKHGVVPKEVMPETHASSNTHDLNVQLQKLLRRSTLELRDITNSGQSPENIQAAKNRVLSQVYRILSINLGTPPTSFNWQWRDDKGEFHNGGTLTPLEFFAQYVDVDLTEYVCLVDDPRPAHPKGQTLTVQHLGNTIGGRETIYLNIDIDLMKQLAQDTLVAGEPVWFGCDVSQSSHRDQGLLVHDVFAYNQILGVDLHTTKEQRVIMGDSAMTHAMLFTGVDVKDGKPVRWRVENSWGEDVGNKGFFVMDDQWFTEYVFEVVVKKTQLPAELQAALDSEPIELPAWDPMGALA